MCAGSWLRCFRARHLIFTQDFSRAARRGLDKLCSLSAMGPPRPLSGQRSTGAGQGHLQKSSRHQWGQEWPGDTHRVCCAGHTPLALLCHHKSHWDLLFSVSYWNRSLNLEGQLGSRKHTVQACHSDLDHLKMSPNLHVLPSFLSCQLPQHFGGFQHCKAGSWTSLPVAHRHEIKT